jgi:zinc transport system substrate-binding protein
VRTAALLAALGLLVSGCASDERRDEVVVGVYPLQWVVQQLVADSVTVTNIVPVGAEPHDVELTPRQVAEAQAAQVFRLDGFQPALDDLGGDDVWQADGLDPIEVEGTRDPHVWLDPVRMKALAGYVEHVLVSELGYPTPEYGRGLSRVEESLDRLDRDIRAQLTGCRTREVVTSHAAFAYFAQRYGLTQRGITGLSPESEPSPRRLAEIAAYARDHGVRTIFFESLVSPKVAQTVAREVGATTAVLDPLVSVSGCDDYLSVMRRNAATLHRALGCA